MPPTCPEGSIVATRHCAYFKDAPGRWTSTNMNYATGDWTVQEALDRDAEVLRHGFGDGG